MNAAFPALLGLALFGAASAATFAAERGDWSAALRYRYEGVDDDAFARAADAHTARLRLGWTQPFGRGFTALVEGEAVTELSERFNSTANGHTLYPLVADARATELNRLQLEWRGTRAAASAGRQRLALDNQRFVGNVGWRQNEQTFDAISFELRPHDPLTLRYHWLDRVHRVNGDEARDPLARERRLDAHLLNTSWTLPVGALVGYAYLVADRDVDAASTRTVGLRWSGKLTDHALAFGWSLEAARQLDYDANPARFSHAYALAESGLHWRGIDWKLGFERLGGNGAHAFQTPLATLHAFNGWADKFTATPVQGLEDRYLGAGAKFGRGQWSDRLNWALAWHDFRAARGDADYGHEWNASLGASLGKGWSGLVKFADYRTEGFARDTQKLWLQLDWAH
jgi:hypothetical protein